LRRFHGQAANCDGIQYRYEMLQMQQIYSKQQAYEDKREELPYDLRDEYSIFEIKDD